MTTTDRCRAVLDLGKQPREYAAGEPLADLPVVRCEQPAGHTTKRHWSATINWPEEIASYLPDEAA